ncbi:MAG: dihydrofolate reductase family protein [Chthonomonas sp.]|nr:dihydrofolate reductase family protein [Chthonomonas sp.]
MSDAPYEHLRLPPAQADRPTVIMNMITTIDGKIVTGTREEAVMDLGSDVDHDAMRQLHAAVDAVIIGAGSLRATPGIWYEDRLVRIVVSRSGDLPPRPKFFNGRAFVAGPVKHPVHPTLPFCGDVSALLQTLRQVHGIERLLVEGGSELNALFLQAGVVDEVFMTLAPKIKLGRDVPTLADGEPLSREDVQQWELISVLPIGNEVFLRYRREER